MHWRAVLLGMVMIATPGLPVAMLLEAPAPVPQAWPTSPQDEPPVAAAALGRAGDRVTLDAAPGLGERGAPLRRRAGRL